ncbi:MAG: PH domain-containing protein [Treponema sp.]|jgi:uncharacterized membrane protein YdbT with pleckstrin-like domain|nr:PH domain-containing protein [Treponema sp.]
MRFIKRKNFVEGEELLYVPKLHWLFLVRPILHSIPVFIILFVLWFNAVSISGTLGLGLANAGSAYVNSIFRNVFISAAAITLLVFLWRVFQYINTEFGVTNKRLIIKKGVFRVHVSEIPTDRIESLYCVQRFWERLFRCGSLYISGIGGMVPAFFTIYRPFALRKKIAEIIEKNKRITVVQGAFPKPVVKEPKVKEDPLYLFGTFVRVV